MELAESPVHIQPRSGSCTSAYIVNLKWSCTCPFVSLPSILFLPSPPPFSPSSGTFCKQVNGGCLPQQGYGRRSRTTSESSVRSHPGRERHTSAAMQPSPPPPSILEGKETPKVAKTEPVSQKVGQPLLLFPCTFHGEEARWCTASIRFPNGCYWMGLGKCALHTGKRYASVWKSEATYRGKNCAFCIKLTAVPVSAEWWVVVRLAEAERQE